MKAAEILKAQGDGKKGAEKPSMDETTVAKMFEEVKIMFQDLPGRLSDGGEKRRRFRRFHPMMFEEVMHMTHSMGEPVGLLIMLSMLRDDMPWLYEVGRELYDALRHGNPMEIDRAMDAFKRVSDVTMRGPWAEEFLSGSKETYMMARELPMMVQHFVRNFHRHSECRPQKREKPESKPATE